MNQKKQQLQHNELADWLELKLQELKPYSNIILTGVIVVIAGVVGLLWWVNNQNQASSDAWKGFFNATDEARFNGRVDPLIDSADRNPNSAAALWSRQLAADTKLKDGLTKLFQDRTQDTKEIEEAIGFYTKVIESSKSGTMLHQHATFGRSVAYEAMGEVSKALEGYQTLVDNSAKDESGAPTSPMGKIAAKYHGRLAGFDGAADFYESFVNYTPPILPPTSPGFGGPDPGALSNDGLRTLPDLSFPDDADLGGGEFNFNPPPSDEGTTEPEVPGEQPDSGGGSLKPPANSGPETGEDGTDGGSAGTETDPTGEGGSTGTGSGE